MASDSCDFRSQVWGPSENLSNRIRKLRDDYFNFKERFENGKFTNEVDPYTTGTPWDQVWVPTGFTVAPEIHMFIRSFLIGLLACAKKVDLPTDFWEQPLIIRKSLFLKEVMTKYIDIDILDGELIAGGRFNTALSRCLNKKEAKKHKKMQDKFIENVMAMSDVAIGNCGPTPGHLIPNYPKVLKEGFKELTKYFKELLASCSRNEVDKKNLLIALIHSAETARDWAYRYAAKAEELAANETDPDRKKELLEMARICRRVPWEPAETFWEAVQSLWFTHALLMSAESYPGPGVSFGRIDQYLYPFYKKDIEKQAITRDFAKEILQCFWIKCNYVYDYQARVGSNQGITSAFGQLITLSGLGPNGEDLTNDLTYLMLDVIDEINMLEPKPNVRLHKKTPEKLLDKIVDMISRAQGAPFLLNFDENSIRGLEFQGLPKDKLWDYAPVGCLENTLQGCDRSGTVDVNLNVSKAIEFVLFNGKDLLTGKKWGLKTGNPLRFQTFDEFLDAYKKQIKFLVNYIINLNNLGDKLRANFEPTPYVSMLVDGCAESGRDITQGGALYNFITVEGIGFATAVDSLLAVKKFIYDEKSVSMKELIAAIEKNYEGNEPLRQRLLNKAPKFGCDSDEADEMAALVNDIWTSEVLKYRTPTGKKYRAGYLSWNYWVTYGNLQVATPDGRKHGMFLSNGICPVAGADKNGPTSVIKSVGKVGLHKASNGASHTISFNPAILRDAEHAKKFKDLLRTYVDVGGTALQINMINADMLREAKKHPEDYRNLLVRVTGYNAYFVTLGAVIQDEIISRESHRI
ncbi:MAG: pyruvate formate lyase family protein [Candidatus Helarchaeota archaeon]